MTSGRCPLSLVKIEAGSAEETRLANDALSLLSALSGGSGGGASPSPRSVGGGGGASPTGRSGGGGTSPRSVGGGGASPTASAAPRIAIGGGGRTSPLSSLPSRAPLPEHQPVRQSAEELLAQRRLERLARPPAPHREVRHVTAAGPPIAPGPRKGRPLASTPAVPAYAVEGLLWNRTRSRNSENRYSYSGTWKNHTAALRCARCQQFFFVDEIGAGLLPEGFLPHQRNYRFNCAWCEPTGAEVFEVTSSSQAIPPQPEFRAWF